MSNRKNPPRFTVDFINKKIAGTKASFDKAKRYGSSEYNELRGLMNDNPGFEIVVKTVKQNKSKQAYKKLDFTFIERYISIQPDAEKIMREYEAIKISAKSLGRSVYPDTKRWFIERFSSEDKLFNMDEAAKAIEAAAAQAGAAA